MWNFNVYFPRQRRAICEALFVGLLVRVLVRGITQKVVHGYGWSLRVRQHTAHGQSTLIFEHLPMWAKKGPSWDIRFQPEQWTKISTEMLFVCICLLWYDILLCCILCVMSERMVMKSITRPVPGIPNFVDILYVCPHDIRYFTA